MTAPTLDSLQHDRHLAIEAVIAAYAALDNAKAHCADIDRRINLIHAIRGDRMYT